MLAGPCPSHRWLGLSCVQRRQPAVGAADLPRAFSRAESPVQATLPPWRAVVDPPAHALHAPCCSHRCHTGALIYTESSRLKAASLNGADLTQDVLSAAEDRIVKAVRRELERHRAAVAADLARHMEEVDRVSHHHHTTTPTTLYWYKMRRLD